MLNDLFITREAICYLQNYVEMEGLLLPDFCLKLQAFESKKQMSYQQWWSLLDELAALHPVPALGLEIGRLVSVKDSGVLGYLFRTSSTIGEGLNGFLRFQRLIYAGGLAKIEQGREGSVSLVWDAEYGYSSQLSDELLLAAMVNISREIAAPVSLNLFEVNFTQGVDPESVEVYEDYFACPVKFNQARLSLSFQQETLGQEIVHHDEVLHTLLGSQAEALLSQVPEDELFFGELSDAIMKSLHEGCAEADMVAKKLNMSARTLHRKLKDKGRVYRDILRDVRKSMAIKYLDDAKLTLIEISYLLGYSEQSTFTRAFSNWFGKSPLRYRKEVR